MNVTRMECSSTRYISKWNIDFAIIYCSSLAGESFSQANMYFFSRGVVCLRRTKYTSSASLRIELDLIGYSHVYWLHNKYWFFPCPHDTDQSDAKWMNERVFVFAVFSRIEYKHTPSRKPISNIYHTFITVHSKTNKLSHTHARCDGKFL